MTTKKYSTVQVGDVFGNWTVIDATEEYIYPDSAGHNKYTKGVTVQCPHTITKRSTTALHRGDTTGCVQCMANKRFLGHEDLSMSYLNSIMIGAKKRNLEYDVAPEYLWTLFMDQDKKCALSDVEITLDPQFSVHYATKRITQTASLDRINSSRGYVEGNVQWVHKNINLLKGSLSQSKFIELCELVTKTTKPEPKIRIVARTSFEGIHRWAQCPIEEVSYLRNYHRHIFNVIAKAYASHDDRDIEFVELSHKIRQYLTEKYYDNHYKCLFLDDKSCEMIANDLCYEFKLYECEVNEDGEGGSIVRNI